MVDGACLNVGSFAFAAVAGKSGHLDAVECVSCEGSRDTATSG